ncbi:HU family DNA-binding protein [Candidatus Woesearchaeota archaeon]|nr:HU family DNA-binding protein [Candidatus Woesearchaeota archaeon]
MNKAQLIDAISESANITRIDAARALEAFVDTVTNALKNGDKVSLIGFGIFEVKERAERQGINPRNPTESITIKAAKIPAFRAGKSLKDAVNF